MCRFWQLDGLRFWVLFGQIILSVGGSDGVARRAARQARGEHRTGGNHAVAQDPRFEDVAAIHQRGAGLPDPALDEPFRQGRIRPI